MDLSALLKKIQKEFRNRKKVTIENLGIDLDLEILTVAEEQKVLAAIKDLEAAEYVEGLKRYTLALAIRKLGEFELDADTFEYTENEQPKSKSKLLFMTERLAEWPSNLIDTIFGAYTDLQAEVDTKVGTSVKYEKFQVTTAIPDVKPKLRRVEEDETPADMDDVDRLNKQVEKEIETANINMAEKEMSAQDKM